MTNLVRTIIIIVMILNDLLFVGNIYVLGDREAAINMHTDLSPSASALMANTKVIICFVVDILYLLSAYGIIRRKFDLALAGAIGFVLFDGFYVIEIMMWSVEHPRIWLYFGIFGGLSLLIGIYSFMKWRTYKYET